MDTCDEFSAQLAQTMDRGGTVRLDLSGIEYIDSSGLLALAQFLDRAVAQKQVLVMTGISPDLMEIFELVGFTQVYSPEWFDRQDASATP